MKPPGTSQPEAPPPLERQEGPRPGSALRQVATLAGATFREAVRMKAFAAPVVFAATAVAASPFLPSDGTAAGAVRLAISVSLVTASIFGTFAAVMIPSLLAAREARDRTAYLVATKPVPPWAVFAGRALGVSCVMAATFAGMAVLSWAFVRYAAIRESRRGERASAEVAEVLVERTSVPPEWETGALHAPVAGPKESCTLSPGESARWRFSLPPVRGGSRGRRGFEGRVALSAGCPAEALVRGVRIRAVDPRTGEGGEGGELELVAPASVPAGHRRRPFSFFVPAELVGFDPDDPRRPGTVDIEVENRAPGPVELVRSPPVVMVAGSYVSIGPGGSYTWQFRLGGTDARAPAFVLTTYRQWARSVEVALDFHVGGAGAARRVERRVVLGTRPEATVEVPPEIFAPQGPAGAGFVTAVLRNTSEARVRIPTGRGLVFAPRAGTFAGALARWALLETSKAVLIVIVTCAAATFLTFPVPALAGGAVAVGGYLMTFVLKLLASAASDAAVGAAALELFLRLLLPDLTAPSVSGRIADGAFVPAGFVAACIAGLVLVRGGVIGLAGAWLASRREVGA